MPWLDTARRIVERHQYEHVDPTTGEAVPKGTTGAVLLDATTASLMVQVHDALGPDNQARFTAMPLSKAAPFTYRLLERTKR